MIGYCWSDHARFVEPDIFAVRARRNRKQRRTTRLRGCEIGVAANPYGPQNRGLWTRHERTHRTFDFPVGRCRQRRRAFAWLRAPRRNRPSRFTATVFGSRFVFGSARKLPTWHRPKEIDANPVTKWPALGRPSATAVNTSPQNNVSGSPRSAGALAAAGTGSGAGSARTTTPEPANSGSAPAATARAACPARVSACSLK